MFKKTLIAAALAVAATGSFAQVYVQGAIGQGKVAFDCGNISCKNSNSGNKLVVGFQQKNGLAYEGQIISYGKQTATGYSDTKVNGFGGNVAYFGNFSDDFGYRVAAGLGFNKAADGASTTTTTTQLTLGAGVAYNITKTIALTAEYDLSNAKLQYTSKSYNTGVSLLSVGLRAKF